MGDKITLQGWDGFRGGLSIKGDTTGSHSVFGKYGGYNVMFHVSTLMPYSTTEKQQVSDPPGPLIHEFPFLTHPFFFEPAGKKETYWKRYCDHHLPG